MFTIGVDVQSARSSPFAVLDSEARMIDGGWISAEKLSAAVLQLAEKFPSVTFAIDAPRMALPKPRSWYWRNGAWEKRTEKDKGHGRHCEVVVAAHRLANPQWTPLEQDVPDWMRNGFELFAALKGRCECLEVFPSASYRLFSQEDTVTASVNIAKFLGGPKDMLDAVVAAITGIEFLKGRGQAVGGGDGLGTIVLPRPITQPIAAVMQWPAEG